MKINSIHNIFIADTTNMLYNLYMGMTAKQVIKILKKYGWKLNRIRGSHHVFVKDGIQRPVVVPVHGNTDLGNFAADILKEAGITEGGLK